MPGDSGRADLPAFEEIYARAGDDLTSVPWARLAPHPLLVMWLDSADSPDNRPERHAAEQEALVVGCGLGDDAEELARRGYAVTAFDVSPTAIARCRERFPRSPACYRVADVLNPPREWRGRFGLVVEINTIQSLPRADRPAAIAAIAGAVARGGFLFVRCRTGGEDEPDGPERPWPARRSELDGFTAAGLTQVDLIDHAPFPAAFPFLRVIYQRSFPRRSANPARQGRRDEVRNKRTYGGYSRTGRGLTAIAERDRDAGPSSSLSPVRARRGASWQPDCGHWPVLRACCPARAERNSLADRGPAPA